MAFSKEEFISLYDAYLEPIFRFVALKVGSREVAQDLTSEVFLRFLRSGNDSIQNPRAFLYQIARNVVADHYRAHEKKGTLPLSEYVEAMEGDPGDMDVAALNIEMDRVRTALSSLSEGYREVITWRYVDELSLSEIAALLGKTEQSVRVTLHRALKALKREMEGGV
ncbi:MAG: sigma-70 family RNA polymerase sigma factor [Candidatus Wildermuthbacteria bacterium]|nr:sigma-70 family RNA polymerase sigma factor [Candidatus Wildermuthbacteria bacterium]